MKSFSLLFLFLLVIGCTNHTQSQFDTELVVLIDRTDDHAIVPSATSIMEFTGLVQNPWIGVKVRLQTITGVDFTQSITLSIPRENKFLNQSELRDQKIARFVQKLDSNLTSLTTEPIIETASVIFRTCVSSLEDLAQGTSPKRMCLVYSDLREFDGDQNFYQSRTLEKLNTEPEAMHKLLRGDQPMPDLSGLSVFFIYQPISSKDNREYRIISRFYRTILEAQGASVSIGEGRP